MWRDSVLTTPTSFCSTAHKMADMKQKSLYRGSNNSSEIKLPAVSLHTNSLPLVVPSRRVPVKALYVERRMLFLDPFTKMEDFLLWQKGFYLVLLFFVQEADQVTVVENPCVRILCVYVCVSSSYRGGLRARVTHFEEMRSSFCGAGLWLCAVLLADWIAPTWNHVGKLLSYLSSLYHFFLFYILFYSILFFKFPSFVLKIMQVGRLSLILSAVWTNKASTCRTTHQR